MQLKESNDNIEHPGTHLKRHRLMEDISMSKLSKEINSCRHKLEKIEKGENYARWETSYKLARYFKLETKYFYDEYLEETHDIHIKLYTYIKNNNLSVIEMAALIETDVRNLRYWISGQKRPSRESYYILKEKNIV